MNNPRQRFRKKQYQHKFTQAAPNYLSSKSSRYYKMLLSHLSLLMLVLTPLMASNARPAETISGDPRHPSLQLMTLLAPQVPASQRALYPWVQPNYQIYYPLSTAAGYRQNIAFHPAIGQPAGLTNEVAESRIGFALLLLLLGELIDDRFDSSTATQSNSNSPVVNSPAIPVWPQLNRPRM